MNQVGLFGAHVRADLNVEAPEPDDTAEDSSTRSGVCGPQLRASHRVPSTSICASGSRCGAPTVRTSRHRPSHRRSPRPHWPPRPTSTAWCRTREATSASSSWDPTRAHASTLNTSAPSQTGWGGPSSPTRSASFAMGPTFLLSTTTMPCCACRHFATHTPTRWPSVSGRAARGRSKELLRRTPSIAINPSGRHWNPWGASRGRSTHRSAAWLPDSLSTFPWTRIRGGRRRGFRATGAHVRPSAPFVQTDSGKEVSLTIS